MKPKHDSRATIKNLRAEVERLEVVTAQQSADIAASVDMHARDRAEVEALAEQLDKERTLNDALTARLATVADHVDRARRSPNAWDWHLGDAQAALDATDTEAPQARDERVRAEERRRCEDGWAGVSATMTEVRSRNKVTISVDALAWDTLRSTMGERTGLRRDDDYPGRLPTTDTEEGTDDRP